MGYWQHFWIGRNQQAHRGQRPPRWRAKNKRENTGRKIGTSEMAAIFLTKATNGTESQKQIIECSFLSDNGSQSKIRVNWRGNKRLGKQAMRRAENSMARGHDEMTDATLIMLYILRTHIDVKFVVIKGQNNSHWLKGLCFKEILSVHDSQVHTCRFSCSCFSSGSRVL